ncbi:scavenger receptor cysteine-rich domain-containing protein DMBT1-like isoform X2 [Nelusetta ayraudi]|uniref:scavenger receptor cysteine-rich domain-containing protein DMBT1-like isoform X2 n=1 Tax=Nelusetta ayraudi TaxID=303726 RepID=UPI003F7072C2
MEPVTFFSMVLLNCLSQALQTLSTQTDPTVVLPRSEEKELINDLDVHRLAGKCSFTLTMPGNRSGDIVALPAESAGMLLKSICQDLDCGSVHHVNQNSPLPKTTCFHNCDYADLGLQNCSQTERSNCTVITEAVCENQVVRLARGPDRCAGRVELWKNGAWGTVCDDEWDVRDAHVVCGQLGCGYGINVTGQGGSFPPGSGPIHLDELNCTGWEENLWECPSQGRQTDCGHKEDAGVVCSEMRAIRLSGGLDRCSGKVEIHRNGSWGTVCDNCWNERMASLVCSTLGCGTTPEMFSQFNPPLAHNHGAQWFYICQPDARELWQCTELEGSTNPYLCLSSKASGVVCNGSRGFPHYTTITVPNTTTPATTSWIFESTTSPVHTGGLSSLLSIQLLSTMALCLLLLVLLITNTVLCCHYRKRHAFLVQQTRSNPQAPSEHHQKRYPDNVNLTKVTSNACEADDSQRYKTDSNPLNSLGLECLAEEAPPARNKAVAAFLNCGDVDMEPQYSRVSKISVDSFESSSTSSEECYENTNGYVVVSPDPVNEVLATSNPPWTDSNPPSAQTDDQHQTSDDEDDGPLYSPVSPDQDSEIDDEYDDVADVEGNR